MSQECLQLKDELVTLIYPDEAKSPELEAHLASCTECQEELSSLTFTSLIFKGLPDLSPPAHLSEKVYARLQKKPSFLHQLKLFFLHPASVGLTVFCLTLAGSMGYQKYFSEHSLAPVAENQAKTVESLSDFKSVMGLNQPAVYRPNFKMVGWEPPMRFVEDLDRPVLTHTDTGSLEQASIEAVASFKHQLAMRHIVDGEYEQAHVVLNNIANNYMNYSHWEHAVLQHMRLMKKMGRDEEMKKDLGRLQEYAMATPEVIRQAQEEANF